ncbi:TetR family transcriptional regulator [Pseudonocardia sp. CA-107938]|uniref:TetR/AcrR family transcriptional regulator n=1 Tax=Pseudonocardia sp. CA-107938 TaxID=3240021 RepID=UPI003D904DF2
MSSPKSRRELYSEATRAALLETATRMFAADGFTKTSLDDIATATQVTRGAVYHHFANKTALFVAVIEAQEQVVVDRAVADALAADGEWAAAMAALDAYLDSCCDPVYGRLCWIEAPIALGYSEWLEWEADHTLGLVEKFVVSLIDAGVIGPTPVGIGSRMVFHLMGGAGSAIAGAPEDSRTQVRQECGLVIKAMVSGLRIDRS